MSIPKRRYTVSVVLLVITVALLAGCGMSSKKEFVIQVTGTAGLKYSGSYMVVASDGTSQSKTVDGQVGDKITVEGSIVSVAFQKQDKGGGMLKVEILSGGKVIAESDTTAAFGMVTVATK